MKTQYIEKNVAGTFYYSGKEMTKLHREDGPAVEFVTGTKAWYLNGKQHRLDGPAVEYVDGSKVWCLNDEKLTEQEHSIRTKKISTIEINGKHFTIEELNKLIETAR